MHTSSGKPVKDEAQSLSRMKPTLASIYGISWDFPGVSLLCFPPGATHQITTTADVKFSVRYSSLVITSRHMLTVQPLITHTAGMTVPVRLSTRSAASGTYLECFSLSDALPPWLLGWGMKELLPLAGEVERLLLADVALFN